MINITWTNTSVKLGDLKPWADNPKLSTKAQAKRILDSWQKFGQVMTVAVDPDLNVLDGHQRLSVLLTLYGVDYQIDARQASRHLSDEERRAMVLALTNATGSWNWDSLAGWKAEELKGWGFDKDTLKGWNNDASNLKEMLKAQEPVTVDAPADVDRAAELLEKWKVSLGDMYQIGDHRLICGDCTDAATVARVMGGERAELLVTDPPYNVDKDYGDEVDDSKSKEDYKKFLDTWFMLWHGVSDRQIVTIGRRRFEEGFWNGLPIKATGCWTKTNAVSRGRITQSSCWEPIIFSGEGWNRTRPNDVFDFPVGMQGDTANHPCPKPLKMWLHLIEQYSKPAAIVADCFDGAGTTLVACEQLGRIGRASELEPKYVAVSLERMSVAFPHLEIKRV